nr:MULTISPECIES: helix-turn-helix domain-containing protein [unclassified Frankia]
MRRGPGWGRIVRRSPRMTVAARLLREGRAPLRRIAGDVGYDSEFAFARAFKRVVGQSPGRYRSEHRPQD